MRLRANFVFAWTALIDLATGAAPAAMQSVDAAENCGGRNPFGKF